MVGGITENKFFQLVATVYGPYAFGVISLLIVWYAIVSPQLERQAIDFKRNESVVESTREIAKSMENVVIGLQKTADALEHAIEKINVRTTLP